MPDSAGSPEGGDYYSAPEWSRAPAIIANVAAHLVAAAPAALHRLVVPSLMARYHVSPVEIGYMFSLGALCTGLCAILVGINARRMNHRLACTLAMATHVVGALVCLEAANFTVFLIGRAISATADGVLICSANAALARSSQPTRNWTYCAIVVGLAGAAGNAILGRLIPVYGMGSLFVLLAVVGLVATPSQLLIPGLRPPPAPARGEARPSPLKALSEALRGPTGLMLMGTIALFTVGSEMLAPFEAVIGRGAGLRIQQIGDIRGVAFAVATAALVAGLVLNDRVGRTLAFLVTGIAIALADGFLGSATTPLVFAAAVIVGDAAHRLNGPYYASVLARHDRTGSLNGAAIAFVNLGSTVGPVLGGYVRQASGGYSAVGWAAMSLGLIGFAAMAWLGFAKERGHVLQAAAT